MTGPGAFAVWKSVHLNESAEKRDTSLHGDEVTPPDPRESAGVLGNDTGQEGLPLGHLLRQALSQGTEPSPSCSELEAPLHLKTRGPDPNPRPSLAVWCLRCGSARPEAGAPPGMREAPSRLRSPWLLLPAAPCGSCLRASGPDGAQPAR